MKIRDFGKPSRLPGRNPKRYTVAQKIALEMHGSRCHYCGSYGPLVFDHIVPLSGGGTNNALNLLPACVGCNLSKRHEPYEVFLERVSADLAAYETWFCMGDVL